MSRRFILLECSFLLLVLTSSVYAGSVTGPSPPPIRITSFRCQFPVTPFNGTVPPGTRGTCTLTVETPPREGQEYNVTFSINPGRFGPVVLYTANAVIAEGQRTCSAQIETTGVNGRATLEARLSGAGSGTASTYVDVATQVILSLNPPVIQRNSSGTLDISLDGPADGRTVRIRIYGPAGVRVEPSEVVFSSGGPTTRSVRIISGNMSGCTTITALVTSTRQISADLLVAEPVSTNGVSLTFATNLVRGGNTVMGTVRLSQVSPLGSKTPVKLQSSHPVVTVPANFAILPGSRTGSFEIRTNRYGASICATITAEIGKVAIPGYLLVTP